MDLSQAAEDLNRALAGRCYSRARSELILFCELARRQAEMADPSGRASIAEQALRTLESARLLALAGRSQCAADLGVLKRLSQYLRQPARPAAWSITG